MTVDATRHAIANQTAARFSDLDAPVVQLFHEGEFGILNPDRRVRAQSLARLSPTDRIAPPTTRQLPGLSRF